MESTNVEEESSDAAAYGLVALCDRNSEEEVTQEFAEEIVETSELVTSEVTEDGTVQIFVQSLGGRRGSSQDVHDDDEQQVETESIIILEHQQKSETDITEPVDDNGAILQQTENILQRHLQDSSIIEVVHQGEAVAGTLTQEQRDAAAEIAVRHIFGEDRLNDGASETQQHVEIAYSTTSNTNERDCETLMLTSLDGIETVTSQENNQNNEIDVEAITDEQGKILINYAGGVLDENYFQALKTRQTLLREAVEWKVYAKMLLEKGCSIGANYYEPEVLTVLKATDDIVLKAEILSRITEKDMLQPAVQFWDFEKVYEVYGNGRPLNCPSCSMPLSFVPFGGRFALRMLYDVDRPVLLVTSFLRCQNKGKKQHEILGYDPRLLRMFPNLDLPFMLFHKAGITKQMMEFIMENVINGMTVNRLFDVVKTKYEVNHTITSQFFANEIESIRAHVTAEGGQIEISKESMFPPYVSCHPSKALLGRCFLASFKEKDDYYKFCMQQLLANECLILDESLCVGARIGIPGVWGSSMKMFPEEYQGMFLVFNEAKHILSWTFLKDGTFREVEGILTELKDRHGKSEKSLKACFTTKCCEWRDELRKVFGKWFIVKGNLRLFLDRVIKEMPPDHTYYVDCVNELNLVFRDTNDTGEIRKDYTGDPVIIGTNLQEFIKRWKDVIDDRIQAVLTEKAMQYLKDLEQHIKTGCLSGIPPEVGDENFNDVHNALRKSVSHCRITVPLVSALFSMCLHDINRTKGAPVDFQYQPQAQQIVDTKKVETKSVVTPDDKQTVSIQTDDDENIANQLLPQLVVDKQRVVSAASIITAVHQFYNQTGKNIPSLLLQALMYYKYEEDFDAFAPQSIQNLRLLPYYSSALNLVSHPAFPKEEKIYDLQQITQGLSNISSKIRRMHIDLTGTARLNGTTTDIFSIVARQLLKDKMMDNLSVEVLEYIKQLLASRINLLEMKEKEIITLLKLLANFHDVKETAKKELLANVSKNLNLLNTKENTNPNNENLASKDGVFFNDSQVKMEYENMEVDSTGEDNKLNTPMSETGILMEANTLIYSGSSTHSTVTDASIQMDGVNENLQGVTAVQEKSNVVENISSNDLMSDDTHNASVAKQPVQEEDKRIDDTETATDTTLQTNQHTMEDGTENAENANETAIGNEEFEILKTLADKLGVIITVLTNLEHCWVIPIFPEVFNLFSPHVFIVYRYQRFFPAWLGNRASVSSIRNINLKRQGKLPQCRCGRGTPGKGEEGRCFSRENGKYLSRCICFRLDRGCTDLCDCRCCANPFGSRPEKPRNRKAKIPYRQRYAHEAAKIATCKSSSAATTIATQTPNHPEIANSENDMASWVSLEHCIFEALINEIKSDDNVITPTEVQETFNSVVLELLNIPELHGIAYAKSIDQIALKLQQREKDVADYLKIYQQQVDLSLG